MPHITILPVHLRNKIAAGEVIERPASVAKELVENAIDAEATEIRVDILRGGKRLIGVSDNGTGMDREDAVLCFQRHATSKLRKEEDLFDIRTLGFRGEALPSVASVSRVKLVTGIKGAPAGVSVEVHGGETRDVRDSSFAGTSIEVRDLFYNTPARKKFLKADSTELFHIIDVVTREALAHFDRGFIVSAEKQETMNFPRASGCRERILQIFGGEFLNGLKEVTARHEDMELSAFVSQSTSFRNRKSHQFIFVNQRPIRDQMISHAVYRAYEGILPQDQHPVFFIFLRIDPKKADFNVHPTKREIRFEDKESVYTFLNRAIRAAVREERKDFVRPFSEAPISAVYGRTPEEDHLQSEIREGYTVAEHPEFSYEPALPSIYLGDTFVAISGRGGLTLLDHHAAHERVLYEKFLKGMASQTKQLLFPRQVRLSHKEYLLLLRNAEVIRSLGIDIDDFGQNTLIVRAIPDELDQADLPAILSETAAALAEEIPSKKSYKDHIAAKIACHSSIRGKGILTQEELARLLSDLDKTEYPDQCPHGRPTRLFFSLADLKKMFKRS